MYFPMLTANAPMMNEDKFLSKDAVLQIQEVIKHFPVRSAACIEGLKIIQKHHRWVSDQAVKELGEILEMSPEAVDSVATYYNLIFRRPVGRNVIFLCNSVTCWMLGYEEVLRNMKNKIAIGYGETTLDDRFTLLPIPCLGTCDHAPAMMINEDLHQDISAGKLDEILDAYK